MPEELKELKNVSIQLDSQTAERIADRYITFKYVENFSCVLLVVGFFAFIAWVGKKMAENC